MTSQGQSFDVENDRIKDISVLTIKVFNGCCSKKGYKAKYYFNEKGQAIKSTKFFRLKKLAEYEYQYDSLGNLTHEIQTFDINNKNRIDTNLITYSFDSQNRIIKKVIKINSELFWTKTYSKFNEFNKPKLILSYSHKNDTSKKLIEYNDKGFLVKTQIIKNDSIETLEIIDYNDKGDISYSSIPSIKKEENKNLAIYVGGSRHSSEEKYHYEYDRNDRWTKKYLIDNKTDILQLKRKYK